MKEYLPKRLLFVPLGIIAYAATLFAQANPDWAEAYSQTIYPVLSSAVGFLPSLAPFSVAEWFAVLFVLFCLGYVGYYARRLVASKGERGMVAYRALAGAVAIACVVYFAFTALCGLNYYRHTFTYHSGLVLEESSTEELEQLCASLVDEVGQAREQVGRGIDPYAIGQGEYDRYAQKSIAQIKELADQYPVLERPLYSAPKPVALSEAMSDAGIAGMFFPFTVESNINVQPPLFTIPATMAHELAHQCGFMREDEANFIAYLACRQSDDPLMRYSGLLLALDHSLSALGKVDPDRAAEIATGLPQAVKEDGAQRRRFWAEHDGVVSDISNAANDAYLKANRQTDGVKSYGRMVDLLLAERRAAAD